MNMRVEQPVVTGDVLKGHDYSLAITALVKVRL